MRIEQTAMARRLRQIESQFIPTSPRSNTRGTAQRIVINGETYYIDIDGQAYLGERLTLAGNAGIRYYTGGSNPNLEFDSRVAGSADYQFLGGDIIVGGTAGDDPLAKVQIVGTLSVAEATTRAQRASFTNAVATTIATATPTDFDLAWADSNNFFGAGILIVEAFVAATASSTVCRAYVFMQKQDDATFASSSIAEVGNATITINSVARISGDNNGIRINITHTYGVDTEITTVASMYGCYSR